MVSLNRDGLTETVLAGERISIDAALELYRWPLEELGALANVRRDLAKAKSYGGHGREIVTYIVDRNINYTNVCNVYCKFCAFFGRGKEGDDSSSRFKRRVVTYSRSSRSIRNSTNFLPSAVFKS